MNPEIPVSERAQGHMLRNSQAKKSMILKELDVNFDKFTGLTLACWFHWGQINK